MCAYIARENQGKVMIQTRKLQNSRSKEPRAKHRQNVLTSLYNIFWFNNVSPTIFVRGMFWLHLAVPLTMLKRKNWMYFTTVSERLAKALETENQGAARKMRLVVWLPESISWVFSNKISTINCISPRGQIFCSKCEIRADNIFRKPSATWKLILGIRSCS